VVYGAEIYLESDSADNIYIEKSKNYVFTIEHAPKAKLATIISQCRLVQPGLGLAKRVGKNVETPLISKVKFDPFRPPREPRR
jgi:hypothetical protein